MKRMIISLLAGFIILALFWVAGLDIERGGKQAWAICLSLYVSGMVFLLGDWERQK